MTVEEAKKELSEAKFIYATLKSCMRELEELQAIAYSPKTMNLNKQGYQPIGSNNDSPTERNAISILELRAELDNTISKYSAVTVAILKKIAAMPNKEHEAILRMIYIDRWSYRNVGNHLHMSYGTVKLAHDKAIQEYAKIENINKINKFNSKDVL